MAKVRLTRTQLDIIISKDGKGYSVQCIQIPNVVTQGETIEKAKENIKEALELYLEEVPEEKKKIITISEMDEAPLISRVLLN